MAFDRICSILLYMSITALTCMMARKVRPLPAGEPVWTGGRRSAVSCRNRLYVMGIFLILFLLSAFRFDIGNDYRQYTQTAHEAYVGGYVVTETGFNLLVRALYLLSGGEYYELVFAVFAFFTLLLFLRAFQRQSADFSQTFFLFMTLGLYFQTFNTVRYYLALAVALFSMKYVLEKDYITFVFLILMAALFHKSVLLVLPVYWIATFAWKRWQVVAGLAVSAACFAGRKYVLELALVLYPSYRNTVYLEGGTTPTSIIRILAVLALYLWFVHYAGEGQKEEGWYRELRFYGQLSMLAFVASTFFSFLPVVTRIAYYFGVSQLFMIPLVIQQIGEESTRRRVRCVVSAVCMVYFAVFLLQAHQDGVKLLPYRSWLFEEQRFIYK